MHIVILGAGKTGAHVAQVLSEEQHDVVLIDKDPKVLEQVGRECDVATLHNTTLNSKLFEELMSNRPSLFFAATGDDATNLVSCSIAKNLGFPKTIARVKEREFFDRPQLDFSQLFFVDHFIGAERLAAQDLFNLIVHSSDIAVEHFAHGNVQMRTLQIPERWDRAGVPLKDLTLPNDLMVGLIRRKTGEGEKVLFPHGDDHILPGDEVTVVGESKVMHRLHEIFHSPEHRVHSVVLVGGSDVVIHLTHFLSQQRVAVRIIEADKQRCEELAEYLPMATIINRDGRDAQLLKAERIQDVDAFVSCVPHDGDNILIASLAKQLGCKKSVAVISDPTYSPILEKTGVIAALSARVNVANRILSILHEEIILSVASLGCDIAKIIELKVSPSSPLVGVPLSDLSAYLPKDLLIAVIESRGKVMIGKGNRILSPDDIVIAICHHHQIPQIPRLFH